LFFRDNLDVRIGLAHHERLQFRRSCSSAANCPIAQYRVTNFVYLKFLKWWLIIINLLSSTNYFANWGDFAPPEIMDNLITIEKIEEMTSPRVIKSHLPFQLLPPNLLDTAKVRTFLSITFLKKHFDSFSVWLMTSGDLRCPQSQGRHRFLLLFPQISEIVLLRWRNGRLCRLLSQQQT
jgi:hypothetical protein